MGYDCSVGCLSGEMCLTGVRFLGLQVNTKAANVIRIQVLR